MRRLSRYLYLADLYQGKRVLEVECGHGHGAHFLANHGAAHERCLGELIDTLDRGQGTVTVEGDQDLHGRGSSQASW